MHRNPAELERHDLSAIWGDVGAKQLKEIAADIAQRGIQDPVTMRDGKVIDGWNRCRAAIKAGVDSVPTVEYDDAWGDPVDWVIGRNAMRRHLSPGERARIVIQLRPPTVSTPGRPTDGARTMGDVARDAGVSISTARRAGRRAGRLANTSEESESASDDAPQARGRTAATSRQKIRILENTVRDVMLELQGSERTCVELRAEICEKSEKIASLREQLAESAGEWADGRIHDLEQQLEAAKNSSDYWQRKHRNAQYIANAMRQRVAQLESQLA